MTPGKHSAQKKGSLGVFSVEIEADIESAIQQVLDEGVEVGDIGNEPLFRFRVNRPGGSLSSHQERTPPWTGNELQKGNRRIGG